jgi:hypothetical protein
MSLIDVSELDGAPRAAPPVPRGGPAQSLVTKIEVEQRFINFGQDLKFEDDPFNVTLHGLLKSEEYRIAISKINDDLKECRATNVDHALLAMGPFMLPLIPWAIRNKKNKIRRKKIMENCVNDFNKEHPHLFMRWETRPEKKLVIMTRGAADAILDS